MEYKDIKSILESNKFEQGEAEGLYKLIKGLLTDYADVAKLNGKATIEEVKRSFAEEIIYTIYIFTHPENKTELIGELSKRQTESFGRALKCGLYDAMQTAKEEIGQEAAFKEAAELDLESMFKEIFAELED